MGDIEKPDANASVKERIEWLLKTLFRLVAKSRVGQIIKIETIGERSEDGKEEDVVWTFEYSQLDLFFQRLAVLASSGDTLDGSLSIRFSGHQVALYGPGYRLSSRTHFAGSEQLVFGEVQKYEDLKYLFVLNKEGAHANLMEALRRQK